MFARVQHSSHVLVRRRASGDQLKLVQQSIRNFLTTKMSDPSCLSKNDVHHDERIKEFFINLKGCCPEIVVKGISHIVINAFENLSVM